ncbi:hypothetical protein B808_1081 [Fructilactobacillus florum 8D]|uniref:RNA-binding S4 domain-containing protein n=1 Tax=Fructilactobacillus florum 8D TaxID=1221538 RepID=W9ECY3_9LACO|nr:YlmH/Sll1252 family protein [Fructilactobacillus florum]EKK20314.1 hypothetical protein B807_953 [Fructilactobacillus florum 2F]ETO39973.1 hypothetical protein B808_1081 [Fructilactobacillus florum 8D]
MTANERLQQHVRPSERFFLQKATDWVSQADREYRPVLTDFLNRRERYLVQTIVNQTPSLQFATNGGFADAEMQRGLVFPDYFVPQLSDFELQLMAIDYPMRFATIKHYQILGALLGTGVKREVLGDVITNQKHWQFYCEATLVKYLQSNLTKIGSTTVSVLPVSMSSQLLPEDDSVLVHQTLQSLRIDNVIAAAFHISRQAANDLVRHGQVRLNWFTEERPAEWLTVQDLVSVRGQGRFVLQTEDGFSKKGKIKATLAVIKHK